MAKSHPIVLLTTDREKRERWARFLRGWSDLRNSVDPAAAVGPDAPWLIVTDQFPIATPLGELNRWVSSGETAVVGIGTKGAADVVLPSDCSERELQLVCQLLSETVRLRRRLAEELRSVRALRTMVYRDPLTGLANRRKWDQEFLARCKSLATVQPPAVLAVVLFDLDLFKRLNDLLGHVTGDDVLRRVGQGLAANLADQHLAARLGGDEFAVLLTGLLAADIPGIVETLRRSLEFPVQGEVSFSSITASAGVVIVEAGAAVSPQKVLEAADLALRKAKQQGRDRMVIGKIAP